MMRLETERIVADDENERENSIANDKVVGMRIA